MRGAVTEAMDSGRLLAGWFFRQSNTVLITLLMTFSIMVVMALGGFFNTRGDVAFNFSTEALWLPTVLMLLFYGVITLSFSSKTTWVRALAFGFMFVFACRYEWWRLTETLNFDDGVNTFFSILLAAVEFFLFFFYAMATQFIEIKKTNRTPQADALSQAVINGEFCPSVDVFIPTYNEPDDILTRTVIGCQRLDYPNYKIYLLDDQRRPHVEALAAKLGCHYIKRADNKHFKAGNVNNALAQTSGELVVLFDADFVPKSNFLTRTVGFFQKENIALVQTPQHFYNTDPFESNLGLSGVINNEQALFFRHLQPCRDSYNAAICAGTSFIVRRDRLAEIGGIPTESITEDLLTSLKFQIKGYEVAYLNEVLSAGDSPAIIDIYLNQRLRWCRGTLQTFFTSVNPFVVKGLTLMQRFAYCIGILYWFNHPARLILALMPVLFFVFGIMPVKAAGEEILFFFVPYYIGAILFAKWLNGGYRSPIWNEVYEWVVTVPITLTVLDSLIRPFSKGFSVTPKSVSNQAAMLKFHVAFPILLLMGLYGVSLVLFFKQSAWTEALEIAAITLGWTIFNLVIFWLAFQVTVDIPQQREDVEAPCLLPATLTDGFKTTPVTILVLSERHVVATLSEGANMWPTDTAESNQPFELVLYDHVSGNRLFSVALSQGNVQSKAHSSNFSQLTLVFQDLTLDDQRYLSQLLFSQPSLWQDISVKEKQAIPAFFKAIFKMHPFMAKSYNPAV